VGHDSRLLFDVSYGSGTGLRQGVQRKESLCIASGLKELYGEQLETELIRDFEEAMNLRQEADYGLVFSEEGAANVADNAKRFLNRAKEILHV
jgi:uncharacterized protein (UPF0332 family)